MRTSPCPNIAGQNAGRNAERQCRKPNRYVPQEQNDARKLAIVTFDPIKCRLPDPTTEVSPNNCLPERRSIVADVRLAPVIPQLFEFHEDVTFF